jgi:hypothetical protein
MHPSPIAGATRCAATRAMHLADLPAAFGRGVAAIARCLGLSSASGRVVGLVHS